jgi:AAA family ATP:ADP antiporter
MAYIPLSEELKSKGKAAADVIGGRLGKSGGALIQQFLLIIIPGASLVSLSSSLFVIFLIIMVVWLVAVYVVAGEFKKVSKTKSLE